MFKVGDRVRYKGIAGFNHLNHPVGVIVNVSIDDDSYLVKFGAGFAGHNEDNRCWYCANWVIEPMLDTPFQQSVRAYIDGELNA